MSALLRRDHRVARHSTPNNTARKAKILSGAIVLFFGISSVSISCAASLKTIPLSYGANTLKLGADEAAVAILARRENFNAHSFDVLTLYTTLKTKTPDAASAWQFVPTFDSDKELLTLTAGGGADCVLHDFRLVRASNDEDVGLIVADRDFGGGYADQGLVQFKFFQLRRNLDGVPGRPALYFERTRTTVSKGRFCDVGEAFAKELGVEPYRPRD